MTGHRRAIMASLGLMLLPLLYAVLTFAARPEPRPPWLEAPTGTTCILPRAEMLRGHMTHLKQLRVEVVREGKRDRVRDQGITSCRACHAHRERFCDRCHEQAGVRPDCFGCHVY